MDAARRWQIASLATAVTSLGLGGLLLSRPSIEPVAPIVLDAPADQELTIVVPPEGEGTTADEAFPSVDGVDVVTPQTPVSLASLGSPDSGSAPSPARTTTPAPAPTSSPTPSSTVPAPVESVESDVSVDSADSLDSD